MSTEWFIQAFENETRQMIEVEKIKDITNTFSRQEGSDFIKLNFDELNSSTLYFNTNEQYTSCLTVSRPCPHRSLETILFRIMSLGNFILYAPDGKYPIIADDRTEKHIPKEMLESIGSPKTAFDEDDFSRLLNEIYL